MHGSAIKIYRNKHNVRMTVKSQASTQSLGEVVHEYFHYRSYKIFCLDVSPAESSSFQCRWLCWKLWVKPHLSANLPALYLYIYPLSFLHFTCYNKQTPIRMSPECFFRCCEIPDKNLLLRLRSLNYIISNMTAVSENMEILEDSVSGKFFFKLQRILFSGRSPYCRSNGWLVMATNTTGAYLSARNRIGDDNYVKQHASNDINIWSQLKCSWNVVMRVSRRIYTCWL